MFFDTSLIAKFVLVIGCGVSVPFLIGNQWSSKNKGFSWNKNITYKYPVLDCWNKNSHYQVYIGLEKNTENVSKIPTLKIVDVKAGETVDWTRQEWQLRIFGSGNVSLEQLDGRHMGNYEPEKVECSENKFEVKEWMFNSNNHWEKDITEVRLKLSEQCDEKDGRKECGIKVAEGLGIGWKTNFNPKVTILVS